MGSDNGCSNPEEKGNKTRQNREELAGEGSSDDVAEKIAIHVVIIIVCFILGRVLGPILP